jgi:hypothetical protein
MQLIVPAGHVRNASVGSVFGRFEREIRFGVGRTVRASFVSHPVLLNLTDAIIKERIDFCIVTAAQLIRDLHWSPERVIDTLPEALKAKLDGTPWEPSSRDSWGVKDPQ